MAYSVQADIEKSLPTATVALLTDDVNGTTIDVAVLNEAVADADETIDAYLRSRYTVPLNPVPAIIKKLSVDLAIWELYTRRPESETPEDVKTLHADALKLLKDVQAGRAQIGAPEETDEALGSYKTNRVADDRVFDTDKLDRMLS
ncbi:MAG: DUF1320 domain-containing protein [Candidatus Dadabacteria bacterium]|nr:DUF1320 domain-containing protein [Candidatus Dadabacteria bacterium]